jgi:hypothetical protein
MALGMYGIYLKCESCGATLGGEQVSDPPLRTGEGAKLRAEAQARGWHCDRVWDEDLCPECAQKQAGE